MTKSIEAIYDEAAQPLQAIMSWAEEARSRLAALGVRDTYLGAALDVIESATSDVAAILRRERSLERLDRPAVERLNQAAAAEEEAEFAEHARQEAGCVAVPPLGRRCETHAGMPLYPGGSCQIGRARSTVARPCDHASGHLDVDGSMASAVATCARNLLVVFGRSEAPETKTVLGILRTALTASGHAAPAATGARAEGMFAGREIEVRVPEAVAAAAAATDPEGVVRTVDSYGDAESVLAAIRRARTRSEGQDKDGKVEGAEVSGDGGQRARAGGEAGVPAQAGERAGGAVSGGRYDDGDVGGFESADQSQQEAEGRELSKGHRDRRIHAGVSEAGMS